MLSGSRIRLMKLTVSGFVFGVVLAVGAPPAGAIAEQAETCKCTDNGEGSYKCKSDHKGCEAGSEWCQVVCV